MRRLRIGVVAGMVAGALALAIPAANATDIGGNEIGSDGCKVKVATVTITTFPVTARVTPGYVDLRDCNVQA